MYMVFAQAFKFAHGVVAGLMNLSLPGSWGAYVGLSSLAGFKVLSASITTVQPVKIDRLGAFGETCSGWMEAAATACMVALQRYYNQVCYLCVAKVVAMMFEAWPPNQALKTLQMRMQGRVGVLDCDIHFFSLILVLNLKRSVCMLVFLE